MDDEGNELGSGIMELTQTELILHTHKRDAVRWPYLCLRRYGYDSNLFSFESGRRCQTGQGEWGGSWRKELLRFLFPGSQSEPMLVSSQIPASNESTGSFAASVPPEYQSVQAHAVNSPD